MELHCGPCLWKLLNFEFQLFEEKPEFPAMTAVVLIFPSFSITFIKGEKSDFIINLL